ncbi:uncharacterized protein LOC112054866 isoform X2 [Bicyclus anynana]|uniref:Uncharacterized protein LOC112054866 isoform X2 n=1 Tax=Bicyclus anynana TaxID=110368 RepID=A0ABM3LFG7_BICAN|nr:uncharacterized protein LOC112054866 isoform X2 [Bicyclus anynana]
MESIFPFSEFNQLNYKVVPKSKNSSAAVQQNRSKEKEKEFTLFSFQCNSLISQYVTFVAGACLMFIYYRKNDFLLYAKRKIKTINKYEIRKHLRVIKIFSNTAAVAINLLCVAILRIMENSKGIFKQIKFQLSEKYNQHSTLYSHNVNLLLLNKLREYSQERKNMGRVIIAAIQENKDIKMRYQLEMLAKNRLAKHIEDTQKQVKENKSRYLNFQQLYLTTHQENIFLKSRIKKLALDKEDAEKNLMKLVNHVWRSKNNELKAYCTRFIVGTKNNLLNSDVRAEIDQFLSQSCKITQRHNDQVSRKTHYLDTIKEVNENCYEETERTLMKDAPKLTDLSGVWAVKDKDGFIERLYEYGTDLNNGDTVKRIRQYSVYFDKDCFLNVSRLVSKIIVNVKLYY